VLEWVIDKVDLVLLMSVNPGFGGQSFIDSTLRKIEHRCARLIDQASGRDIRLEVDGGIKVDNIRRVADAGADTFVRRQRHLRPEGLPPGASTRCAPSWLKSNPGMSSRIAHHIDFPDYAQGELLQIAERMLQRMNYRFGEGTREAFDEYLGCACSSRTSPTRAACATRSTARGCARPAACSPTATACSARDDLTTLLPADIRASRVFQRPPPEALRTDDRERPQGDPMPLSNRWTLTRYLIEERRRFPPPAATSTR
jgi:hypothetical protein